MYTINKPYRALSYKNILNVMKIGYVNLVYKNRLVKQAVTGLATVVDKIKSLQKSQSSTVDNKATDMNINNEDTPVNKKDNSVRSVDSANDLNDDEINEINMMCKRIAKKRAGWSGLEFNDLTSELWIKAIEVINSCKCVNYRLLYTCLNNRSFDMCRLAKKSADNQFAVENVLPYRTITSITHIVDYNGSLHLKDLIHLFPYRSRERKYIMLLAQYIGLGEFMHDNVPFSDLFEGIIRRECELAKKLGFANDTSNGYRSLKQRVRDKIIASGLGEG